MRLKREERRKIRSKALALYRDGVVTKSQVEEHKTEFAVIGMIAASIAAQLAWYFIKRWLDKKLAPHEVPDDYQPDDDEVNPDGEGEANNAG
jgi:hypothetical protein